MSQFRQHLGVVRFKRGREFGSEVCKKFFFWFLVSLGHNNKQTDTLELHGFLERVPRFVCGRSSDFTFLDFQCGVCSNNLRSRDLNSVRGLST